MGIRGYKDRQQTEAIEAPRRRTGTHTYISMKMEPKGRIPDAGITNMGSAYQGATGIGRGMLLTRQGMSLLPAQCLPKMVPTTLKGRATNSQIAAILRIIPMGSAPTVL